MTWKSSTLDDFEGHWQAVQLATAILATAGLLEKLKFECEYILRITFLLISDCLQYSSEDWYALLDMVLTPSIPCCQILAYVKIFFQKYKIWK